MSSTYQKLQETEDMPPMARSLAQQCQALAHTIEAAVPEHPDKEIAFRFLLESRHALARALS